MIAWIAFLVVAFIALCLDKRKEHDQHDEFTERVMVAKDNAHKNGREDR